MADVILTKEERDKEDAKLKYLAERMPLIEIYPDFRELTKKIQKLRRLFKEISKE